MALRSLFRRPHERVFRVELTVYQLDSVPALHRLFFIYWRARRAEPSDGRTFAQPVQNGNTVRWNTTINFEVVIPSEASDPTTLKPSILQIQLRSERQGRWVSQTFTPEGRVDVDLSEVAAVGLLSRNFLVQDSMLNMTLKLMVRVTHHSGDKIFRNRATPSANRPPLPRDPSVSSTTICDDDTLDEAEEFDEASSSQAETISVGTARSATKDSTRRPLRQPVSFGSTSVGSMNFRQPDRTPAVILPPAGMASGSFVASQYPGPFQSSRVVSSGTSSTPDEDRGRDAESSIDSSRGSSKVATSTPGTSTISSRTFSGWSSSGVSAAGNKTTGASVTRVETNATSTSSVLEGSFPIPEIVQRDLYETFFQRRMRDTWPKTVVDTRVDAEKIVAAVCATVCEKDGIGTVSVPGAELYTRGEPLTCRPDMKTL